LGVKLPSHVYEYLTEVSDTIYVDYNTSKCGGKTIILNNYFPYTVDTLDIVTGLVTRETWCEPNPDKYISDSDDEENDGTTTRRMIGSFETYIMEPLQPKRLVKFYILCFHKSR
jgi:hypothetical protein